MTLIHQYVKLISPIFTSLINFVRSENRSRKLFDDYKEIMFGTNFNDDFFKNEENLY